MASSKTFYSISTFAICLLFAVATPTSSSSSPRFNPSARLDAEFARRKSDFLSESSLDFDSIEDADSFADLFVNHEFQNRPAIGFSRGSDTNLTVMLDDGRASATTSYVFRPPNGLTINDFNFISQSTDYFVLQPEDVTSVQFSNPDTSVGTNPSVIAYNVSIFYEFSRFPGTTVYNLVAVPKPGVDSANFSTADLDIIAAGLVIYERDTMRIVSGEGNSIPAQTGNSSQQFNYDVFIQYVDGSDSNTTTGVQGPPSLNDLEVNFVSGRDTIISYGSTCDINGGVWTGSRVQLSSGCGLGFATRTSPGVPYTGAKFGLIINPNRAGNAEINFDWPQFGGEIYSTSLVVNVTGNPRMVVIDITPQTPYNPAGGENLTALFYNGIPSSNRQFVVIDEQGQPIVFREITTPVLVNQQQLIYRTVFRTQPGDGQNLKWELRYTDNVGQNQVATTTMTYLFSYAGTPVIGRLNPNIGPREGNINITVFGTGFENFNPQNGRDGIYFSGIRIPTDRILFANGTHIIFFLYPMDDLWAMGESGRYTYDVSVQIQGRGQENTATFYYDVSQTVKIIVRNARRDDATDTYLVDSRGDDVEFLAQVGGNTLGPNGTVLTYRWNIFDGGNTPIAWPAGVPRNLSQVTLSPSTFAPAGAVFRVQVVTENFAPVSERRNDTVQVLSDNNDVFSVSFSGIESRSRGLPIAPVQIVADIGFPFEVNNDTLVVYTWNYRGSNYVWSSAIAETTISDPTTSGPIKYGRTFFVPQKELTFGSTPIRLTVEIPSLNRLTQTLTSTLTIGYSTLVAIINNGGTNEVVTDSESLNIFGTNSYDPDILVNPNEGPRNVGLLYFWSRCQKSTSPEFTNITDCTQQVIGSNSNSASWSLRPIDIENTLIVINGVQVRTYIRMNLQVSKVQTGVTRRSPFTTATWRLEPSEFQSANINGIALTYPNLNVNSTKNANPNRVDYRLPLQLTPTNVLATDRWEYAILSPFRAQSLIETGALTTEGNYIPGGGPQNRPLVLKANTLSPGYSYIIAIISYSSPTATEIQQETRLTLQTITTITFAWPQFPTNTGDGNKVWSTAGANVNIDSNNYRFYYFSQNQAGSKFCVGGCTGQLLTNFQIQTPGTYQLHVEIEDSIGNKAAKFDGPTITITAPAARELELGSTTRQVGANTVNDLATCYSTGDDVCISRLIYEGTAQIDRNNPTEQDRSFVSSSIEALASLSKNEVPNSNLATTLMQISSDLACTGSSVVTQATEVQGLLEISNAVDLRTPPQFALTSLDSSLRFFNCTSGVAYNQGSSGSSRRRLLQTSTNDNLIDSYTLMQKQIPNIANNGQLCGFSRRVSTSSVDVPQSGLLPSSIGAAVQCNIAQRQPVLSSEGSFIVCDAQYAEGNRLELYNVETPDYVQLGGLRGATSTNNLNAVGDVQRLLGSSAACYEVVQTLRSSNYQTGTVEGFRYINPKPLFQPSTSNNYVPDYESVSDITVTGNQVTMLTNNVGLYSVNGTESSDRGSGGLSGGAIAGIVIGALLGLLIALLIIFLIATRCCYARAAPVPVAESFAYVERDIYGRGFVIDEDALDDGDIDEAQWAAQEAGMYGEIPAGEAMSGGEGGEALEARSISSTRSV